MYVPIILVLYTLYELNKIRHNVKQANKSDWEGWLI